MKSFALKIAVFGIRTLAALAGLFASRRSDIVLISCQGNKPSQDLLDLAAKLSSALGKKVGYTPHGKIHHPDAPYIRVLAGKMRRDPLGALLFVGRLFSMLRYTARARIVIVDAYCLAVSIPKKKPGQTVIQLWHAPEAIKKFSLQVVDTPAGYSRRIAEILRMHRGYDYILCPSDATRPFFEEAFGYPGDAFVKLGLPSLDRIGLVRRPVPGAPESPERIDTRAAIYKRYPELTIETGRPLTVVYAPTFRDGVSVDAAGVINAFERIKEIALILKLHPLDKEAALATASEAAPATASEAARSNIIADAEFPLTDWYAAADAIITDYSGVAVEAAAAGVASYYYTYDIDDYASRRGLNVDLRKEATGKYAFTEAGPLAVQIAGDFGINRAGRERVYDYEALAAFAGKYLEVPLSGNTQKLAEFISKFNS